MRKHAIIGGMTIKRAHTNICDFMPARVEYRLGSIFDEDRDLLLIPVTAEGAVFSWLAKELGEHGIHLPFGLPQEGALKLERSPNLRFKHVAYAVLVRKGGLTEEALEKFGSALGRLATAHGIRSVAMPLVGNGPTRTSPHQAAEALARGFSEAGPSGATLLLHVQNRRVYQQITAALPRRDSDGHIGIMALLRRSLDTEILEPTPQRRASPPAPEKPAASRLAIAATPARGMPAAAPGPAAAVRDGAAEAPQPVFAAQENSAAAPRPDALAAPEPSAGPSSTRTRIFISYSHADLKWLKRLQEHLRPLEREGTLIWDDTRLKGGSQWREEIRQALAETRVAVLLVSAAFIASDFIVENELPPLLKAADSDGATILPVIISASRFDLMPELSRFQAANDPRQPLMKFRGARLQEELDRIARKVEAALKGNRGQR